MDMGIKFAPILLTDFSGSHSGISQLSCILIVSASFPCVSPLSIFALYFSLELQELSWPTQGSL